MPIVDSHCHVSEVWYEPVEALLWQMEQNGVDHAVLIQMQGQSDNRYQAECVRKHPGRFASVVIVDSAEQMEREAGEGASGVRLKPDAPPPLWDAAQQLGLAVSCGGSAQDFASFEPTVRSHPGLKIVIEHLGGLNRPDGQDREKVCALARYPNVYMKFHGLGEFAQRAMPVTPDPFVRPLPTTLRQAFEAFGPERMMWGSDYPPVSSREGYRNSLRLPMAEFGEGPHFGDTALTVFPLR